MGGPGKFKKRLMISTCDKVRLNQLALRWKHCFDTVKKILDESEKKNRK